MRLSMRQNYYFRSKRSAKRYLLAPVLIQLTGTLLFVFLAYTSLSSGLSWDKAVVISTMLVALYIVGLSFLLHVDDLRLLAKGMWPLDSIMDAYRLLDSTEKLVSELYALRSRVEKLLISWIQLQNEARSIQATHLEPKIREGYSDGLELRNTTRELLEDVTSTRDEVKGIVEQIEQDPDIDIITLS